MIRSLISIVIIVCLTACQGDIHKGFVLLDVERTGLDFSNNIQETDKYNIFSYQYYYNGGGVAVADFNNDGLEDIFFSGNMVGDQLYINKGNFQFENITWKSGLARYEGWSTGANVVDINNDGWMDIYVSRGGFPFTGLEENLLFINKGNNIFTESAAQYGIDDSAYSTHSAFFDYDRDGDLDLFLINHPTSEYSTDNPQVVELRKKTFPEFTNKLYQNNNGSFSDVSLSAGITGSVLAFSLGLSILDINNDDYPDIFISNDYSEPDHLFINQKDGTFKEEAEQWLMNQSKFSRGVDFADIDHDQHSDIVVLDRMGASNYTRKMQTGIDDYDRTEYLIKNGFLHQHNRNTLHLNMGSGAMREVSQVYGISTTGWSWSPLFFDFDNDTKTDLFVSNGYLKDHTNKDFLRYIDDQAGKKTLTLEEYFTTIPMIKETNYFFKGNGTSFESKAPDWMLNNESASHGAAYADFDNDGDLDLVVNNSNDYAYLYENRSEGNNWLTISLKGDGQNINAIGSKVTLYINGKPYLKTLQPSRGFMSAVSHSLSYGMGNHTVYDSIQIVWPTGEYQTEKGGNCCRKIEISKSSSVIPSGIRENGETIFQKTEHDLNFIHYPSKAMDFGIQGLMPFYLTDNSPHILVSDIDDDGLEDIIVSGSEENETMVFYQNSESAFSGDTLFDVGPHISGIQCFDLNNDGKKEIVFSSGSYNYKEEGKRNEVIILWQKGNKEFEYQSIPLEKCNPSSIYVSDFDQDGDVDIFCGGTYWNGRYPEASPSCLLKKDAQGQYVVSEYIELGGITTVQAGDLNNDGKTEIITAGHWSKVRILNYDGTLTESSDQYIDQNYSGFWNTIKILDMDGDGDQDIVAGNLGINSSLTASHKNPVKLLHNDIDGNGSIDPVIGYYLEDDVYPFPSLGDLTLQVPELEKHFPSFDEYAKINFEDLINISGIKDPKIKTVNNLQHMLFINDTGKFTPQPLPVESQYFPVFTISNMDVDKDGAQDLYLGGNKSKNQVKIGNLAASRGTLLHNTGNNKLEEMSNVLTGLNIKGEQRSSAVIHIRDEPHLVTCSIGGGISVYKLR